MYLGSNKAKLTAHTDSKGANLSSGDKLRYLFTHATYIFASGLGRESCPVLNFK
jgi:hypothetical protein